jgi:hypothetical protein
MIRLTLASIREIPRQYLIELARKYHRRPCWATAGKSGMPSGNSLV